MRIFLFGCQESKGKNEEVEFMNFFLVIFCF
jgi:hypothetical protein